MKSIHKVGLAGAAFIGIVALIGAAGSADAGTFDSSASAGHHRHSGAHHSSASSTAADESSWAETGIGAVTDSGASSAADAQAAPTPTAEADPAPTATATPSATATTAPTASSSAMPVGDLPGWKQVLTQDFNTNVSTGAFPGPYASSWMSYNGFTDTSGVGEYDQNIISANEGVLNLAVHTSSSGEPLGAAPIPLVDNHWGGQTYGRFSVRMRADSLADYGAAFLLWSDANNWNDGEIDFPEGDLNGTTWAHNHCPGNPSVSCLSVDTGVAFTSWHTYTIDWTPSSLQYEIDGKVVAQTDTNIPSKPLHWVMQVGTTGTKPDPSVAGNVQIDWATVYTYNP